MQEIICIAAAAKSAEMKSGIQSSFTSPIPTRPSSPQGTPNNVASPKPLCFPGQKSSICGLQGGTLPISELHLDDNFLTELVIYCCVICSYQLNPSICCLVFKFTNNSNLFVAFGWCLCSEFPIARRQSLQRFLEKRRDRYYSTMFYWF